MAHLGYFQNLLLLQIMLQEIVLNLLMLSFIYEVRRNLISFIFVIFFLQNKLLSSKHLLFVFKASYNVLSSFTLYTDL